MQNINMNKTHIFQDFFFLYLFLLVVSKTLKNLIRNKICSSQKEENN